MSNGAKNLGAPSSSSANHQPRSARWHSRGYLPHFDAPSTIQSITFRLADSLPQSKLKRLEKDLVNCDPKKADRARRQKIEGWLDSGIGCCALRHPEVAKIVQDTLLFHDNDRYHLLAWCIMPNHVHVLIEPKLALAKIVQSWKSYTGKLALQRNAELELGVPGPAFWMRDYWDRFIRSEEHFDAAILYIQNNPVSAGLVATPEAWLWSSASLGNKKF